MTVLLCDLDDTLASRRSIFANWAASYLIELGEPSDDLAWFVDVDENGNRPRDDFFRLVIDRYALGETVETLRERYHQDYISQFRCEPESIAALKRVRAAGYKVAIITNGDTRSQGGKIAVAGLAGLVDAFCISEAEGYWKPAPELFRIAAERCGGTLEGGWMVGDNPIADIGGASACGMSTVWIRADRAWPEGLDYRPTHEADSVSDAVDLMLQHPARHSA